MPQAVPIQTVAGHDFAVAAVAQGVVVDVLQGGVLAAAVQFAPEPFPSLPLENTPAFEEDVQVRLRPERNNLGSADG